MEFRFSTLGDAARVNLPLGCGMGGAGGIEGLWMGVGGSCWRGVIVG
jgi:hypothetical protein